MCARIWLFVNFSTMSSSAVRYFIRFVEIRSQSRPIISRNFNRKNTIHIHMGTRWTFAVTIYEYNVIKCKQEWRRRRYVILVYSHNRTVFVRRNGKLYRVKCIFNNTIFLAYTIHAQTIKFYINFQWQNLLTSGSPPCVVQQLAALPLRYFSRSEHAKVLMPALLACCTLSEPARNLLHQEVSQQVSEQSSEVA